MKSCLMAWMVALPIPALMVWVSLAQSFQSFHHRLMGSLLLMAVWAGLWVWCEHVDGRSGQQDSRRMGNLFLVDDDRVEPMSNGHNL